MRITAGEKQSKQADRHEQPKDIQCAENPLGQFVFIDRTRLGLFVSR